LTDGRIETVRIALGSIAPIPLRCVQTENALRNQTIDSVSTARAIFASEISPIDDLRSTRDYRLSVSLNLLEDFINELSARNPELRIGN